MTLDLKNVTFSMPIDDVFELDENDAFVFVTGHVETGVIRANTSVIIVDSKGNVQVACVVTGIISQSSLITSEKNMLESASEYEDDYWGIALIFSDREVLNCANSGMFVVIA